MDIVKNLKDYDLTPEQRIFVAFIKEYVGSSSCLEKIKNAHYIFDYTKKSNDFLIYSTSIPCVEAKRITYNYAKKAYQ